MIRSMTLDERRAYFREAQRRRAERKRLGVSLQRPSALERFWSHINKDGPIPDRRPDLGPCWVWIASTRGSKSYGSFFDGARSVLAHRFAWEAVNGAIPGDLTVDARKMHCPKGHPYDEANTRYWHGTRYCRTCESWGFRHGS